MILVVTAALASMATECEQSPRGLEPSPLAMVTVRLESQAAAEPTAEFQATFERCLARMDNDNKVKPSWRNYAATHADRDGAERLRGRVLRRALSTCFTR